MKPIIIDLETRSACDLRDCGVWQYANHPTTRLLTVTWRDTEDGSEHVWLPGLQDQPPRSHADIHLPKVSIHVGEQVPSALCRVARRPWVGHNVTSFDSNVWRECTEGFDHVQWVDTMPLALACGMPGGLDAIGKLLWGEGKYEAGKDSLKKAWRATGEDDCEPENVPIGQTLLIAKYNLQDVRLTHALWDFLQTECVLPPMEHRIRDASDAMNRRGVRVDIPLVRALVHLSDQCKDHAVAEIARLTGGALPDIAAIQSRTTVLGWLKKQGVELRKDGKDCLAKDLVRRFIDTHREDQQADPEAADEPDEGREPEGLSRIVKVLELRMAAMRVTGGKLFAALCATDPDGRFRYGAQYWGAHCVSGDTEVLTPTGWVRIDCWSGGSIAQWTPGGRINFAPAVANAFDTDEPTVTLSGPYTSGVFTLGHHVPVYNRLGQLRDKQAGELPNYDRAVVPLSGVLDHEGSITAEQMRVLVAVQADGSWTKNNAVRFSFKKPRKIERIQRILNAAGISFRMSRSTAPGVIYVRIARTDVPPWLTREHKVFGPWLLDSTAEARRAFLEELEHWDGDRTEWNVRYASKLLVNHEWVATIAHLGGLSAYTHSEGAVYRTTLREYDRTKTQGKHWAPSGPLERVYCPTTPSGYWVFRHNGKIGVTHNTGRWAHRRIQFGNLPRPKEGVDTWGMIGLYERGQLTYDAVRAALPLDARNAADGSLLYPYLSVDDAASALLRSIIIPDEGKTLLSADLSNIEARVLHWVAGDKKGLETYWDGGDPYLTMAERLCGPRETWPVYPDPITGKPLPFKKHPYRQVVGKVPCLACGYQAGGPKTAAYAAQMGFDLKKFGVTGEDCVLAWRQANPAIAGEDYGVSEYHGRRIFRGGLWYDLTQAALMAVRDCVKTYAGRCAFFMKNGSLICELPSGRRLVYRKADVQAVHPSWCENPEGVPAVTYWSPRYGWKWMYGGAWAENIVQAISRDILAEGTVRIEEAGVPIGLTVHDEAVGSGQESQLPGFMRAMTTRPDWLTDFPLDAEGGCSPRYSKTPPPGTKDVVWRNGSPK